MASRKSAPRRSSNNNQNPPFVAAIRGPMPPLYRSPIDCLRPGNGVVVTNPGATLFTGARFTVFFPGVNR